MEDISTLTLDDVGLYPPHQKVVGGHLFDEHIRLASALDIKRIEPGEDREDPVALVCSGPSLKHTWKHLGKYPNIITVSGTHRYLLDRGIVPTWHVEVDANPHKIDLIGQPDHRVKYLIASTCHPDLFEHLRDYDVTLWHPKMDSPTTQQPPSTPKDEWIISGGSNVGLRAMMIARFLGFHNIGLFGMDYSYPPGHDGEHVMKHPNPAEKHRLTVASFDGVEYPTTYTMFSYINEFFFLRNHLGDVNFLVFGQGLLQHMVKKKYIPECAKTTVENPVIAYKLK